MHEKLPAQNQTLQIFDTVHSILHHKSNFWVELTQTNRVHKPKPSNISIFPDAFIKRRVWGKNTQTRRTTDLTPTLSSHSTIWGFLFPSIQH